MQKKKTLNKTEYIRNASEQSANKLFWYLSQSFKANEVNLYDNKQTNTHKTLCLLWAALQASGQFLHVRNKVFLCKFKPLSWFNDDCVTLRDVSVSCSEISSNTTRAQRRTRRLHFRATKLFIAYLLSPVCGVVPSLCPAGVFVFNVKGGTCHTQRNISAKLKDESLCNVEQVRR